MREELAHFTISDLVTRGRRSVASSSPRSPRLSAVLSDIVFNGRSHHIFFIIYSNQLQFILETGCIKQCPLSLEADKFLFVL